MTTEQHSIRQPICRHQDCDLQALLRGTRNSDQWLAQNHGHHLT